MSNGAIGGLVVIFLVACILIFAALDWPYYAEYQYKANKKAYWSHKRQQPYGADIYRSPEEKERHEHEHREDEKDSWFATKTLSSTTIIIAAIGAIFAFLAYRAARDQANTAIDQERRQLRAYLGPEINGFEIKCLDCAIPINTISKDFPQRNAIAFKVKNFGITPARNLGMCSETFFVTTKKDFILQRNHVIAKCDKNRTPILYNPAVWPSESRIEIWGLLKDIDKVNRMIYGETPITFFSQIEYVDIFQQTHYTYVCRIFSINEEGSVGPSGCNPNPDSEARFADD